MKVSHMVGTYIMANFPLATGYQEEDEEVDLKFFKLPQIVVEGRLVQEYVI